MYGRNRILAVNYNMWHIKYSLTRYDVDKFECQSTHDAGSLRLSSIT